MTQKVASVIGIVVITETVGIVAAVMIVAGN